MLTEIDNEHIENIRTLTKSARKFRRACDYARAIKFDQMAHDLAGVSLIAAIDKIDEANKEQGE